jgi:hypothetical protein
MVSEMMSDMIGLAIVIELVAIVFTLNAINDTLKNKKEG